jgi:hypothetical protein
MIIHDALHITAETERQRCAVAARNDAQMRIAA